MGAEALEIAELGQHALDPLVVDDGNDPLLHFVQPNRSLVAIASPVGAAVGHVERECALFANGHTADVVDESPR